MIRLVASAAFLIALSSAASALAYVGPFTIPVDELSSSVTVQVCIPGGCDSDVSGVSGYSVIALDDGAAPSMIELHDFDLTLTDQINIDISIFLGGLTATGDNLRLLYAQPGTPFGPDAIEGGGFLLVGVPQNAEGTVAYDAAGTVCVAMQAGGMPCSDTQDLSQQGTQTGDISGTLEITDGIATLTINPNVEIPFDPANPELGTLTVTGTVTGSAPVPGSTTVPARPMPDDAFDIDGTVRTCTTDADCLAGIGSTSEVYCVGPPAASGGDGVCYVQRNRYIAIKPNVDNAGLSTARRIKLSTGETLGWVGPPVSIVVGGPEPSPQSLARIQSAPHYMDWSTVDTVHVGDCAVVPEFVYEVQAIVAGEDEGDEASYSEPLVLSTVLNISGTGGYGDVVGASPGLPPDGTRSFKDISAVVGGFQSLQLSPKAWLDLQGSTSASMCPDFGGGGIDFNDINRTIAGFQGGSYFVDGLGNPTGFLAPLDCPPNTCP